MIIVVISVLPCYEILFMENKQTKKRQNLNKAWIQDNSFRTGFILFECC